MKRLAIYVFYDPQGVVRDYVVYFLKELQKTAAEILVVVNGKLNPESRSRLDFPGIKILVRQNNGFDFWGWKAGIETYGYDKIKEYDELLLTNNSIYGPVYPFAEVFEKMSDRSCDFWGMNRHPAHNSFWIEGDPESMNEQHIQSYWLVFRQKALKSQAFENYWRNLPPFADYQHAVGHGETKMTAYFEKAGLVSDTYMDFTKYSRLIYGNPMYLTDKQIMEDRYPFLKRKLFCMEKEARDEAFNTGIFDNAKRALEFLRDQTNYDTSMIWQDLLQTQPMSLLNDCLGLTYISSDVSCHTEKDTQKTAVIVFAGAKEPFERLCCHLDNLPLDCDIFIVSENFAEEDELRPLLQAQTAARAEFRKQQEGGFLASWLVTCADVWQKYEIVGVLHAARLCPMRIEWEEEDWQDLQYHCLLGTAGAVADRLHLFHKNKALGLLEPLNFDYSRNRVIGNEWGKYEKAARLFLKQNFVGVEPVWDKHVMAPFGGMFWARSAAVVPLLERNFTAKGLAALKDGDNIILRLLPLLVQNAGYYTAFTASPEKAAAYLSGMYYIQRRLKENLRLCFGGSNDWKLLKLFEVLRDGIETLQNVWKVQGKYFIAKILHKCCKGKRRLRLNELKKEYKNKLKAVKCIKKLLSNKTVR